MKNNLPFWNKSGYTEVMNAIIPKRVTKPPTARLKIEAYGLDKICEDITGGGSLSKICDEIGVNISSLIEWIELDSNRSARIKEARRHSARVWDEKAERGLEQAKDKFELEKARDLAHHYRWRAKAIAPRDYGDKITQEVTGSNGGPLVVANAMDFKGLSDKELEEMNKMLEKAAGTK